MTYYVAGPMRGYPDNNEAAFTSASTLLASRGFDVITPTEICKATEDCDHELRSCLARDVEYVLTKAEGVIVLPGWQRSMGCNTEVAAAAAVDKPVFEFGPFLLYGTNPPPALTE